MPTTITLTPENEARVKQAVARGEAATLDEAANRMLAELRGDDEADRDEKLGAVRAEIQKGLDDHAAGRSMRIELADLRERGMVAILKDRESR